MNRLWTMLTLPLLALALGCPEYKIDPIQDDPDTPIDDTGDHVIDDPIDDNIPDDVLTGGVKGRVCSPSEHEYVSGAKVSIEHEYGVATTYTDADGYFLLGNVPMGTHIVVVTKGSFGTFFEVWVPGNEVVELAEEECLQDDLNIAVVTGLYDDIGGILAHLGLSFDVYSGLTSDGADLLRDPAAMEDYDIIFLNCGLDYYYIDPWRSQITTNLRDYVDSGGSIYASDWAHYLTEMAWPNMIDYRGNDNDVWAPALGTAGTYYADVLDPDMQAALGGSGIAEIYYNWDFWMTPVGAGAGTTQLVYGDYKYYPSDTSYTPVWGAGVLAASIEPGSGKVIYTTFHNEAQITLDMERLLQEIIWAL